MYQIQTIDIIAFIVLILVIVVSLVLRRYIKKLLRDIEGDSEIFVVKDDENIVQNYFEEGEEKNKKDKKISL